AEAPKLGVTSRAWPWLTDIISNSAHDSALLCRSPQRAAARTRRRPVPSRSRSSPLERDPNVSRNSAFEIDNLNAQLVSQRTQTPFPECIDLPGDAREGRFPTRLLLIDGAASVRAKDVRETVDLDLGKTVVSRTFNDAGGLFHHVFIRQTGRLAQPLDQRLLLRLLTRMNAHCLGCLLGLSQGKLLHHRLCAGDEVRQVVGRRRH